MVMYRDFVARHARRLDVVGEVENLDDGTVRVFAEGEKDKLDEFLVELKKGSMFSNVENVKVQWVEPKNNFGDFRILYEK